MDTSKLLQLSVAVWRGVNSVHCYVTRGLSEALAAEQKRTGMWIDVSQSDTPQPLCPACRGAHRPGSIHQYAEGEYCHA